MPRTTFWCMAAWLAVVFYAWNPSRVMAQAEPTKPAKARSLDDELLKGLGGGSRDDGERLPQPGDGKLPPVKKKPAPPLDDLDKQLLEGLGEPAGEDVGQDPLVRAGKNMRQAGTLIGQSKTGTQTQELQKRALDDIERLLKQARQQQSQQSSSSSQKQSTGPRTAARQAKPGSGAEGQGTAPATDSADKTDRGGKAELRKLPPAARAEVLKRAWGNLPAKEREQMLQNNAENFLPKYELQIEEYFKALAERQENKK